MKTWRLFVSRHSLGLFFLLAYVMGWSAVIPLKGGLVPYGPMLAGIIVLANTQGRSGVTDLVRWRGDYAWYLIAPGFVVLFHLGAFGLNLLLGAHVTSADHLRSLNAILLLILPLVLSGGMWEELGWSGYALPKLQERFSNRKNGLLMATFVLFILRMAWHIPLVLYGTIPWYELLFYNVALQFLISWLYTWSDRSVPITMLCHLASNVMYSFMVPLFSGTDQSQYQMLFIALANVMVFFAFRFFPPTTAWQMSGTRTVRSMP